MALLALAPIRRLSHYLSLRYRRIHVDTAREYWGFASIGLTLIKEQILRFIAGAICTLVLLGIASVVYIYTGRFDVAASSPHNAFERWALSTTMRRSVVAGAGIVGDPPAFSDEMIKDGFEHFDEMCTGCHGGPGIERSEIGKGLNPQAPKLADVVQRWTPAQLFWIVKHGVKMTGMPSFGVTHNDDEVWSIVAFIEKLPDMSPGQYQQTREQAGADTHEHELHEHMTH